MKMQNTQLPYHPLAEVLPLIEGEEFDQLVRSIKTSGLRDPIILFEGAILDGRNRYRACLKAGVEPNTENFNGGDPVLFVLDRNFHRRHLTSGQKAMALEKLATLSNGQTRAKVAVKTFTAKTRAEIAKSAGICDAVISFAKTIKRSGTPEEIADVTSGKRAISTVVQEVRARRPGGRKKGITNKRLLKIFQRTVSMLCNRLEYIEDIELPKFTDDQKSVAISQLLEAERSLRKLKNRVRHGGSNDGKIQ